VSVAAPLPAANIDTDQICPAQFMSRSRAQGFADCLFHDRRFGAGGQEKPDFVLNQPAYRAARILVAGPNFACGSAREHAVLALLDYGFRVVIAPSIADIFASSALENGLLAITLDESAVATLLSLPAGSLITVDLAAQTVTPHGVAPIPFAISVRRKEALLTGIDPLAQTMQSLPEILAFEAARGGLEFVPDLSAASG
jgi:3-isopropylmalate/(R)-2-methylmalate dehydratase small subunit